MCGCPVSLASPTPGHGEMRKKGKERGRKQEHGFRLDNSRQKDVCQTRGTLPPPFAWCCAGPFSAFFT